MAILRSSVIIAIIVMIIFPFNAYGAKAKKGEIHESDFTYKGISLHDDEAKVLKKLGKPVYTRERVIYGIAVKYHEYKNDVAIWILQRNNTVAEIIIGDTRYKARRGVRYGATSYYIEETYGKNSRQQVDGITEYIYERPGHKYEYLVLELDGETNSLKKMKITRLPMTEEAADLMGEDPMLSNDLFVILAGTEEIDTSALDKKKPKPVKVRGLEK